MNVATFFKAEDVERSWDNGGSDVSDVGLVVKPNAPLFIEETVCDVKVEVSGEPAKGATVGADRMGVPGSTLGIPHATPPGYMVITVVVTLLTSK